MVFIHLVILEGATPLPCDTFFDWPTADASVRVVKRPLPLGLGGVPRTACA